ncbi:MAG: type II toxin-antitoxin system MqsA family antitoxin [Pseudomonadota bacterium]|nr:type II toxin-antitoxin system MqsA family antitoxin [Pseudomonadota bacterium]
MAKQVCHFCGSRQLIAKTVQYTYKRDGKILIVNQVPCQQCEYCGKRFFDAEVLKAIEAQFNALYQANRDKQQLSYKTLA